MKEIKNEILTGERALYQQNSLDIIDSVFENGESPIKECRDITVEGSLFKWKYPMWYSQNVTVKNCTLFQDARAGVWYTNNISVENSVIEAPKTFRRCRGVMLDNVAFSNAAETLWHCSDVRIENSTASNGDYFCLDSEDIYVRGLTLFGNYSFDSCKNVEIHDSRLLTKDAFWNSENVTVYDSFISGEYLGWNSKKLTLVNCTIESLQGLCYIDDLVMKNCKLVNTTLAFEYSTVDAEISSGIDSVLNPKSGTITADYIGKLIIEKDRVDPGKTTIKCSDIRKRPERPDWIKEF